MNKKTGLKKAVYGIVLAAADVLLLTLTPLTLFDGTVFQMAFGWLFTLAFVVIFAMLTMDSKSKNKKGAQPVSLINKEAMDETSKRVKKTNPKSFKKQMRELDNQCVRMSTKTEQLDQSIKSYFGDSRISIAKFANVINGGIEVFDDNVNRILQRIHIFDEDGYEHLFKTHQEYTDAIKPYQANFEAVDADLKTNEEILARFDALLMEVNKLSDPSGDISELPAMQELNELIDQTKLYRTQN